MTDTTTEPTPNVALLDKIHDLVKKEAEKGADGRWDQGDWVSTAVEPELHEDGVYGTVECGTSFCFAGWVVAESGAAFLTDYNVITDHAIDDGVEYGLYGRPSLDMFSVWDDDTSQYVEVQVESTPIAVRAQALLGITESEARVLFHGQNELDDIEVAINQIKDRATAQSGEQA